MNNPRGLTFVEGIAGSGKTSIALGRLKFFANFSTGEERAHYGLRNASANDFSPTNMVGFVLSHSLKRYLKETAAALGLERLPIRDFQEFRSHLSNQFGLTKKFKRSQSQVLLCRTKLAWLLALDAAMARAIGVKLREFVRRTPEIPVAVQKAILKIVDGLADTQVDHSRAAFSLQGFATRLVTSVMNAEFRTREASIQERINRETNRNTRYELRNELERMAKEEERSSISPLARTMLGLIVVSDLMAVVARSNEFESLAKQSFQDQVDCSDQEVASAVAAFCREMSIEGDKLREVTDADLVALIVLSAMIADGFDRLDAPPQLYQIRRNTAAFIDEVQDFSEIEVLLMGMVVTDGYCQITHAGDRRQQLQIMGVDDFRNLFPFVPRALRNQSIFLDHNFRQQEALRILSAKIRSILQGDPGRDVGREDAHSVATLHTFKLQAEMARFVLQHILTVDAYATVAVIMPTELEARRWYNLLRDDLAAYHRPALLSHRDDLTRRNDIHFTEVRETKGLEFDVVIVPNLASFDLESVIGQNELYVSVSRPRHALLLGCEEQALGSEWVQKLRENGIVRTVAIPEHALS